MKLELIGGSYNGRKIPDRGKVVIRLGIAKQWRNGRPAVGTEVGFARYEPSADRTKAFFLDNQWEGTCESVIEA